MRSKKIPGGCFSFQIGLVTATSMVVGNIIGIGIFISPKGVLLHTQSVGMSMVIWCLCGVLSMMGKYNNNIFGCILQNKYNKHLTKRKSALA